MLSILANWVKGALKDGGRLYVDLSEGGYRPLGDIFGSLRPDLAIVYEHSGTIATLELTVCHETNLVKSKQYKDQKYELLGADLKPALQKFSTPTPYFRGIRTGVCL